VPTPNHPLDVFFRPRTVAVIGASETPESVGRTLLMNLIRSPFGGTLYPVNPKRQSVLGIPSYARIGEVPVPVDLAVVATPAAGVPGVIGECAAAGVRGAIVISAGFRETGPAGADLERRIMEQAAGRVRILGPNCVGVMSPLTGLNATFISSMARPGNVAFLSQSGALGAAILDWSFREGAGFSAFVSIGSMIDVRWSDLIEYLNDDPHTQSILLYMESVGNARAFLSAAREAALTKPVIVIKGGRSEEAARAAHSHTGALTGSDEVFDAAFRRCGALRVDSIGDIFHLSDALAKQPRPRGPRLMIVTNAGGPGVLATDALIGSGGQLAEMSAESMAALNALLPVHWSHGNPVDIIGDADAARYGKTLEVLAADTNNDGLLIVNVAQGMTDPALIADRVKSFAQTPFKPVLASWMGGVDIAAGDGILRRAGVATFPHPDAAARVFHSMWQYTDNLRQMYETPSVVAPAGDSAAVAAAAALMEHARASGRTLLTEAESKTLLAAHGIPVVETRVALTEEEAVACAAQIGYPVVVKLHSESITHKSAAGGVRLDLRDEAEVREAWRAIRESAANQVGKDVFLGVTVQPMVKSNGWEVILGSSMDEQFGPVLLFGAGGKLVEVFRDRSLEFPPLNTTLARRMMARTKIYGALAGTRGHKPANLEALEHLMVRFSRLVATERSIREIDINPLLVGSEELMVLDARVVLHDSSVREQDLPRLAIRPYPAQYVSPWTMRSGEVATIRPIAPEDEPLIVDFHAKLSERSVYFRYFHLLPLDRRTAHERLTRICFLDYDREIALVVERHPPGSPNEDREIVGVGRLSKLHGKNEGEFAVLVVDAMQRQGIGKELLRRLIEIGRAEGLDALVGTILPENRGMVQVCKSLGFETKTSWEQGDVEARYPLKYVSATP
jgi:acetyltransferase